jgi:galactose mutarotase-like enzyme
MHNPTHEIEIASDSLSATISTSGAELIALRDERRRELLWDGNPLFWAGRAPLLFPMVGRAAGDKNRFGGADYPMAQHGFARRSIFEIHERKMEHCVLRLRPDDEMRRQYPFAFALFVTYRIAAATLSITARVVNEDDRPLPLSFGFHPAFRWPLPFGGARAEHRILFQEEETSPVYRLIDGYLAADAHPLPVEGRSLVLRDALFEAGALVFARPRSRSLRYGVPGRSEISIGFPDMPHLGVWTKPGAGFICLEPWQGYASRDDYTGEFAERPGVVTITPGQAREFSMTTALVKPDADPIG